MIGVGRKLSFDKANQVFSYFLKSIQIVHDHNGEVKRIWDFDNEMAAFCGGDPKKIAHGTTRVSFLDTMDF